MNKSQFIKLICKKIEYLPKKITIISINKIFDSIEKAILNGSDIEIRGFGKFSHHKRKQHLFYNPKTKTKDIISERTKIHFKPGKELKDRIN